MVRNYYSFLYLIFPAVGILLTIIVVKYLIKKPVKEGIPNALYAISKRRSIMFSHQLYSSVITSAITVGFGGSAGLEAPTVSTNAAAGSNIGRLFRMNYKTRTLLIGCGAAGSLSAIFNAPIAAIIFAIEVLMLDLTTASLIPLLLASLSATLTSKFFFGEEILFHFALQDSFKITDVPFYILLGIATAMASLFYTKVHFSVNKYLDRFKSQFKKAIGGGLIIGAILYVFPSVYGEGYHVINSILQGNETKLLSTNLDIATDGVIYSTIFLFLVFAFKAIATSLTLSVGGVGGIFAPSLFMGGAIGYLFSRTINLFNLTHLSTSNFTLVGMAGLMSGILHAPLTAIFLIAEITKGYELFIPLMITASLSYITTKIFSKHTVYTYHLAQRGELITHDKDKAILTLMDLKNQIEKNFTPIQPNLLIQDFISVFAKSKRNIFPVLDENRKLLGIISLDQVRPHIFKTEIKKDLTVYDLMISPKVIIEENEPMETVIKKFEKTGDWYVPVVNNGKYLGFASRTKVYSNYRKFMLEYSAE